MRILLVDNEPQVLRGVCRTIDSEAEEWEVETASSALDALSILEEEPFDIVVSDMKMSHMDGADFLETVAKRFPKVLRIIFAGHADQESVIRAIRPMHQYLSKPCDPDLLIEVIRRAELFQATVASTEILCAIGRDDCLGTMPGILHEINEEIDSEKSDANSLYEVVSKDPAVCAKILHLANSAIFGLKQPVSDVAHGIAIIGVEMTRAIAIALSVVAKKNSQLAMRASSIFDHSFRVATIGHDLATEAGLEYPMVKQIYSVGLLHDIGKLVLLNTFTDRYRVVENTAATRAIPVVDAEMEEFSATHAGVGAFLLDMWGLPSELVQSVGCHHSPDLCAKSTVECQMVFAANWLANGGGDDLLQSMERDYPVDGHMATLVNRMRDWREWFLAGQEGGNDG